MPRIQVIGCGSLLSERSARRTAPSLVDFRLVRVHGFVRVFNKVSRVWAGGDADRAVAVLAAREQPGASFFGTAFGVGDEDFEELRRREAHYRWVEARVTETDGRETSGRLCAEREDDGTLWRDDILPSPAYLAHCLEAARAHGDDVYEDFCRTTRLADGETTLAAYLAGDTTP